MKYAVGLDVGIASVGSAVVLLDENDNPFKIEMLGSRIFSAAERGKDGASLAGLRRKHRGSARRTRRRSRRKDRIRGYIVKSGLLSQNELAHLYDGRLSDIYQLRVDALDRLLTRQEMARVLMHISQRRGFKSNALDASDKSGKDMKKAIQANEKKMLEGGYRTVGEMLLKDERFAGSKRNKEANYLNTVTRKMIESEVRLIFARQQEFGNEFATPEFLDTYLDILLAQRSFFEGPGEGSPYCKGDSIIADKIGKCQFETDEQRAPRASYSFERSRLLQSLNNLSLVTEDAEYVPLTEEQRQKIIDMAHADDRVHYTDIRKKLKIPDELTFNLVRYRGDKTLEECEKEIFCKMPAYRKIRAVLGKETEKLLSVEQLDEIARVFTLFRNEQKMRDALADAGFDAALVERLMGGMDSFSGFGNLSIKALRNINPHFEDGLVYSDACAAAGYNHTGHTGTERNMLISLKHLSEAMEYTVSSPVAKRAISQTAKVLNNIIREMGCSPVYINIELAREVAKSRKVRDENDLNMKNNHKENEERKKEIAEFKKHGEPTGKDIVAYKLWKEQGGVCPYSQKYIELDRLFNDEGYAEVDHIVPYSVSFDNTYINKVLVMTAENRQKGNRLPMEYMTGEKRDNFVVWVKNNIKSKDKSYRLLKKNLSQKERNEHKNSHLQDTRVVTSFLHGYISDYLEFAKYSGKRVRHVFALNGQITDMLRKRWGLNKVREDGDLHHALDAAVIACTTQRMIDDVTHYYEYREDRYRNRADIVKDFTAGAGGAFDRFPQPWPYFSKELEARLSSDPRRILSGLAGEGKLPAYDRWALERVEPVFVSRMPNYTVTGPAHEETLYRKRKDGVIVKKVPLKKLKLKDGEIEGYSDPGSDPRLYQMLKNKLIAADGDAKKAFAEPVYKPTNDGSQGNVVKRVLIVQNTESLVDMRNGNAVAPKGDMIRVDVYCVENEGYYMVPVYVDDIHSGTLPNKAVVSTKDYKDWPEMKDEDFIFSLYSGDLIYFEDSRTKVFKKNFKESSLPDELPLQKGFLYFKSGNRNNGSFVVITHDNSYVVQSFGFKTLQKLEKWRVDVLGRKYKVEKEARQGFSG
ncbi:MAG: type II CRISPR RNA-guided endonuclease Cas9 [Clostridiales bacterium]|nr:type II CRISPR RNA-guided endonuclease Cas9 [Clostridiales bacterium]